MNKKKKTKEKQKVESMLRYTKKKKNIQLSLLIPAEVPIKCPKDFFTLSVSRWEEFTFPIWCVCIYRGIRILQVISYEIY